MPPMNATTVPEVGPTEFAMTSSSAATTCGSAADSEDRKNRLTPRTTSAASQIGRPSAPVTTKTAVERGEAGSQQRRPEQDLAA